MRAILIDHGDDPALVDRRLRLAHDQPARMPPMTGKIADDPGIDKTGAALKAQRFALEDIARELSARDITFPTPFLMRR
ncbi:MAG: hypothetical protein R3E34_11860 [Rhodocyclaceae bacterium]